MAALIQALDRVWEIRTARKSWSCCLCHGQINLGECYYEGVVGGSGVRGKIDADRAHKDCLEHRQAL